MATSFWITAEHVQLLVLSKMKIPDVKKQRPKWRYPALLCRIFFTRSLAGCQCADNWSYPVRKRMGLTLSLRGHACLIGASSSGEDKMQLELT